MSVEVYSELLRLKGWTEQHKVFTLEDGNSKDFYLFGSSGVHVDSLGADTRIVLHSPVILRIIASELNQSPTPQVKRFILGGFPRVIRTPNREIEITPFIHLQRMRLINRSQDKTPLAIEEYLALLYAVPYRIASYLGIPQHFP